MNRPQLHVWARRTERERSRERGRERYTTSETERGSESEAGRQAEAQRGGRAGREAVGAGAPGWPGPPMGLGRGWEGAWAGAKGGLEFINSCAGGAAGGEFQRGLQSPPHRCPERSASVPRTPAQRSRPPPRAPEARNWGKGGSSVGQRGPGGWARGGARARRVTASLAAAQRARVPGEKAGAAAGAIGGRAASPGGRQGAGSLGERNLAGLQPEQGCQGAQRPCVCGGGTAGERAGSPSLAGGRVRAPLGVCACAWLTLCLGEL